MKLKDLSSYFLKDTMIYGGANFDVESLKAMHLAGPKDLTYILASRISDPKELLDHPSQVIITDYKYDEYFFSGKTDKCFIHTQFPRLQMAKLSHLFDYKKQRLTGFIPNFDKIDEHYFRHESTAIPIDTEIGEGTEIYANVSLYKGVKIGKNCIIHAGTTIGADGFGYELDENGEWFKIAHLGGVVIGDNVEIGANACIDRGTLGDTIIEDGVKIDNLVHIAHNVHMKKNSVAIAQSMIAGSCVIEEGAWIAPCSAIREGLTIGKNSLVGLGSVVVKNVEEDQIVMGVPAKSK